MYLTNNKNKISISTGVTIHKITNLEFSEYLYWFYKT